MQPSTDDNGGGIVARPNSSGRLVEADRYDRPHSRHRVLRWSAAALFAAFALIAIAPQLVAWSPLRHETPRLRLRGFEGRIRVGHASLSWWSPIVLSDMELFAPDGEPFIHISKYTEQRSVFKLLFRRTEPSHIRVEEPRVTLKLRADGSNVEDAMRPVLEHQKRRPTKERSLEVIGGELKAVETLTGRSADWTQISLNVHSSPSGAEPNELHLSTRLAEADEADSLNVHFEWFSDDNTAKPANLPSRSLAVKTANLPLRSLDPLLARIIPDLELSGTITTDMQISLPDPQTATNGTSVQIEGRFASRDLVANSPSRLGKDRLALQSIELEGKASSDQVTAHVDRLDLKTDLGQFSVTGTFPLPPSVNDKNSATPTSWLEPTEFAIRGDLDLVRLAQLLPETLRLREGMQLTEGRVNLDFSGKRDNDRRHWKGRVETTRLAATIGAESFSWEQPIQFSCDLHRAADRIEIGEFKCVSDVIELTGSGNSDDARITGHCNLEQMMARVSQFVDLGDRELKGRLTLDSEWKRTTQGTVDVAVQTTVENFTTGSRGGPLWSEPQLVARFGGRFVDKNLRPARFETLQVILAVEENANDFTARLIEPVDLTVDNPRWNWELTMSGELAQWKSRLQPFGLRDDWKLAGHVHSTTKISYSNDELAIEALSLDLKALRLSAHGLDLSEPEARLNAAGRWNRADRRLSLSSLELTGSAGSARGRDVMLALANDNLPQLGGQVEFHSDLDRLNPADAPPDKRPWSGKVNASVNFSTNGGDSGGSWQVDVENLSIRRQATKLIERRRGDVEPIDPGQPSAPPLRPAPGVAVDRKMKRAIEKAERDARRDTRRREREARKRADEIVLVRETEWQTIWEDSHMTLSGKARFDQARDAIDLTDLEALTAGVRVTANAHIAEASARSVIDLKGEVDCDLERLLSRLQQTIGRHVRITGNGKQTFSLNGPLRSDAVRSEEQTSAIRLIDAGASDDIAKRIATDGVRPAAHEAAAATNPLVPLDLKGETRGGWQKADLFGLQAGPAVIDLRLAKGVVAMQPLEMTLSGGKLRLNPQLLLNASPATLVMPAGIVVQDVELSQDVCDTWLKFVAPILSEATRVEGRFSLDLSEARLPLNDPGSGALSGRIHIANAQVLPGPLFAELSEVIGQIEAAVRIGSQGSLLGLDKPLVQIDKQQVNFKLQDRRLYSSPLAFNVRNIPVRTRGSVGVDQSLDMVAEITLPAEWVRRVKFLASLEGKALEIPIRGTLRHPKVDASGIGRFWEQFGQDALDSLLNGGLQKLIDR